MKVKPIEIGIEGKGKGEILRWRSGRRVETKKHVQMCGFKGLLEGLGEG